MFATQPPFSERHLQVFTRLAEVFTSNEAKALVNLPDGPRNQLHALLVQHPHADNETLRQTVQYFFDRGASQDTSNTLADFVVGQRAEIIASLRERDPNKSGNFSGIDAFSRLSYRSRLSNDLIPLLFLYLPGLPIERRANLTLIELNAVDSKVSRVLGSGFHENLISHTDEVFTQRLERRVSRVPEAGTATRVIQTKASEVLKRFLDQDDSKVGLVVAHFTLDTLFSSEEGLRMVARLSRGVVVRDGLFACTLPDRFEMQRAGIPAVLCPLLERFISFNAAQLLTRVGFDVLNISESYVADFANPAKSCGALLEPTPTVLVCRQPLPSSLPVSPHRLSDVEKRVHVTHFDLNEALRRGAQNDLEQPRRFLLQLRSEVCVADGEVAAGELSLARRIFDDIMCDVVTPLLQEFSRIVTEPSVLETLHNSLVVATAWTVRECLTSGQDLIEMDELKDAFGLFLPLRFNTVPDKEDLLALPLDVLGRFVVLGTLNTDKLIEPVLPAALSIDLPRLMRIKDAATFTGGGMSEVKSDAVNFSSLMETSKIVWQSSDLSDNALGQMRDALRFNTLCRLLACKEGLYAITHELLNLCRTSDLNSLSRLLHNPQGVTRSKGYLKRFQRELADIWLEDLLWVQSAFGRNTSNSPRTFPKPDTKQFAFIEKASGIIGRLAAVRWKEKGLEHLINGAKKQIPHISPRSLIDSLYRTDGPSASFLIGLAERAFADRRVVINVLALKHARLIPKLSRSYQQKSLTPSDVSSDYSFVGSDILQEGYLRLRAVADVYDHSKNIKFSTFAFALMGRHFISKKRTMTNPVSSSARLDELRGRVWRAEERLILSRERPSVSYHDICAEAGVPPEITLPKWEAIYEPYLSLDESGTWMGQLGRSNRLKKLVDPRSTKKAASQPFMNTEEANKIAGEILTFLSPRQIFVLCFSSFTESAITFEGLSKFLMIGRERARQINESCHEQLSRHVARHY